MKTLHRFTLVLFARAWRARAAMALTKLSEDEQRIVFIQLCNVLDPRGAVDFSSASNGLWALTQALRQQLRAEHEAVAVLCRKVGMRSCKELREAKKANFENRGLSAADLGLLGTLGPVLPALKDLRLFERSAGGAGPDGVQRLAEGLGAGALPALITFAFANMHVGDAGASALVAALGRGALPRLKALMLCDAISDAGLVALAPALRRRPALECLLLNHNPFGDEGLAALVAPPPLEAVEEQSGSMPDALLHSARHGASQWGGWSIWGLSAARWSGHSRRAAVILTARSSSSRSRLSRRQERWRSSRRSTSAAPRSPTPAAPPSLLRPTATRCWPSWISICITSPPAPRR